MFLIFILLYINMCNGKILASFSFRTSLLGIFPRKIGNFPSLFVQLALILLQNYKINPNYRLILSFLLLMI